jgi:release factor glutamine methyltransferase
MLARISHRAATVSSALADAISSLDPLVSASRLEAEILLAHALGTPRHRLYAWPERKIGPESQDAVRALVARRHHGEPIAYITGSREFWSIELEVNRDVLIPRPETERLVEVALDLIPKDAKPEIADLGTGCGAIAAAIAVERPACRILATDISPRALAVARRNFRRLGIANARFCAARWLEPFSRLRLELIVCNPPYVADDDPHLLKGDLRFEPRLALAGGADGLDPIRSVAAAARDHLKAGGALVFEHGFDQGAPVRDLMGGLGYRDLVTIEDFAGHDRVTRGRWPG